jgi:hypothetical protein
MLRGARGQGQIQDVESGKMKRAVEMFGRHVKKFIAMRAATTTRAATVADGSCPQGNHHCRRQRFTIFCLPVASSLSSVFLSQPLFPIGSWFSNTHDNKRDSESSSHFRPQPDYNTDMCGPQPQEHSDCRPVPDPPSHVFGPQLPVPDKRLGPRAPTTTTLLLGAKGFPSEKAGKQELQVIPGPQSRLQPKHARAETSTSSFPCLPPAAFPTRSAVGFSVGAHDNELLGANGNEPEKVGNEDTKVEGRPRLRLKCRRGLLASHPAPATQEETSSKECARTPSDLTPHSAFWGCLTARFPGLASRPI